MPIIRVNPEQLRQVSSSIRSGNEELVQIMRQLQLAIDDLDKTGWVGQSRYRIEPLLDQVLPKAKDMAHRLDELRYKLLRIANIFEDRDESVARKIAELPWDWMLIPQESPEVVESGEVDDYEVEEIPSRDMVELIGELLEPIHWINNKQAGEQFVETLKKIGQILNSLTGKRDYEDRLEAFGNVLLAGELTWDDLAGPLESLFFIYDSTAFLSGEMTHKDFAKSALGVLLGPIPIPFLGQWITDWAASNVACPDCTFKIKAGEPN